MSEANKKVVPIYRMRLISVFANKSAPVGLKQDIKTALDTIEALENELEALRAPKLIVVGQR